MHDKTILSRVLLASDEPVFDKEGISNGGGTMTWDPPGLWATIILSIPGGVVAGTLVLAGEVAGRVFKPLFEGQCIFASGVCSRVRQPAAASLS